MMRRSRSSTSGGTESYDYFVSMIEADRGVTTSTKEVLAIFDRT